MKYVALLRGINVGGKNKVDMTSLRESLLSLGFTNVSTYINSGNVFFETENKRDSLAQLIEGIIKKDFGLTIPVVVRNKSEIEAITAKLSDAWCNDKVTKCDVLFLWDEIDNKSVIEQLRPVPGVDEIIYTPGAVLWRISRANYGKSAMNRLVGTKPYGLMTIRNCNTLRKLAERMAGTTS